MKTRIKTKIRIKRKTSKQSVLRHLKFAEHKHNGKLIHHRHTSHLVLIMILVFIGFFLLISDNVVQAQTNSGQVMVKAIVPDNGQIVVTNETKKSGTSITDIIINITWLMTPTPLYIAAFALTLGFWLGDLFDRKFGSGKSRRQTQKTA